MVREGREDNESDGEINQVVFLRWLGIDDQLIEMSGEC